ncbi:Porphobilinogen deaminase [Wickerhamiella sorbophila]|uniref:Porphobilinogen deaminase n=1 Tax=Wickerhamiella sorbophila TaxID=45607 RepID=A0A2T0FF12_9ASCO|nr:Porphobilinogen deaminase [Wickerhamiella sorbophila]PRT53565.1 Porphobilinogen deaminase [Wickerhamiella sorbophila]
MDNTDSRADTPEIYERLATPVNPGTPDFYDFDDETKFKVYVGGRRSQLAVVQSRWVAAKLRDVHPGMTFPVIALSTLGDNVQNKPLYAFGGKALWTKELEKLLLEKVPGYEQVDMVVHSLKDMPTQLPEGCILGAITEREDPRDALCIKSTSPWKYLADLPDGSIVGTSSLRRSAQLRRRYPTLQFEPVRGTLGTRLDKLEAEDSRYAAIILAAAGLHRLHLQDRITSYLEPPDMYYAVGQGALGIEIRGGDARIQKLVSRINHRSTSFRCRAERSLMRTLEGGCSVPIGVQSSYDSTSGTLRIAGIVVSVDGSEAVEGEVSSEVYSDQEADQVGIDLAADLVAKGAKRILDEIHLDHIS